MQKNSMAIFLYSLLFKRKVKLKGDGPSYQLYFLLMLFIPFIINSFYSNKSVLIVSFYKSLHLHKRYFSFIIYH